MKNILLVICMHISVICFSQLEGYIPNKNPISPTAFQFLKFSEIPVNEYNGQANISVPIYTIEVNPIVIPIELNYHGGGIRVAEEATWVGLGWELSLGNITQIVNDRDDLGGFDFILPDYLGFVTPYVFPLEYICNYHTPIEELPILEPISQTHPIHSIIKYTDYRIPINGYPTTRQPKYFNASGWSNGDVIDSEPDIFKAIFNGHHIEFIIKKDGNPQILNKKGYKISKVRKIDNKYSWIIVTPDGTCYFFEDCIESSYQYSVTKAYGIPYTRQEVDRQIINRTWLITKVESYNNQKIEIIYDDSISDIIDFPNYQQTYKYMETSIDQTMHCPPSAFLEMQESVECSFDHGCANNFPIMIPNAIYEDLGFSFTNFLPYRKKYIRQILFTNGVIKFFTSSREDIVNDKKLDSINITDNVNSIIKRIQFSYDYFNNVNIGNGFDTEPFISPNINKTKDEKLKRLKLLGVTVNEDPPYLFFYDTIPLVSKCSFATDYWGFYNGKVENSSYIPNPIHLGLSLNDNYNNHNSDFVYCKAGALISIKYPTGGQTFFEYELNHFKNSGISNINNGNGLRIKSMHTIDDNLVSSSVAFRYDVDGGILFNPLLLFNLYGFIRGTYTYIYPFDDMKYMSIKTTKISGNPFYSSSLLGSGSGVGYNKVERTEFDDIGQPNGKTIKYFYNNQDISQVPVESMDLALPSRKNELFPLNGSIKREEIWSKNNIPVRITEYEYEHQLSDVYYGARPVYADIFGCFYAQFDLLDCGWNTFEQDFVGYYPIYGLLTNVSSISNKEFVINSSPINFTTTYYYESKYGNLVSSTIKDSQNTEITTEYFYPFSEEVTGLEGMGTLLFQNRINHPVLIRKRRNNILLSEQQELYSHFPLLPPLQGNQTCINTVNFKRYDYFTGLSSVKSLHIDTYDNYANVSQYYYDWNNRFSSIRGYNNQYEIVRAENITYSDLENAVNEAYPGGLSSLLFEIGELKTDLQRRKWIEFNANLRNNPLLIKGRVNTFAFKPLIGLISSVDDCGLINYFEYDYTGRLLFNRNSDWNIINENSYHYKMP